MGKPTNEQLKELTEEAITRENCRAIVERCDNETLLEELTFQRTQEIDLTRKVMIEVLEEEIGIRGLKETS